jgi:hypothetical protein
MAAAWKGDAVGEGGGSVAEAEKSISTAGPLTHGATLQGLD